MKEADRRAIEEIGIPGLVLMENAARGCFEAIHQVVGEEEFPTMLVLCGGGNNGGDGLAIARHAAIHEY
ncbi:MAG: bifunctional ADP-dependent NAD(P)H-hydrate dehydratase/NAD(P)H-hydrate epimerase, partial [Candidatus Andersenbacteria bacterium]|nr:bifunctional ADP-dependent NAD(P)H-hydrate dehydratase/NAD(P)H-hydrate epimerase [Candidatus Andersenbacteria bacterium]